MEKIFKYPSIQYAKGYGRSVLQDLQKHSYSFVPNTLIDIIENIQGKTIDEYLKENDFFHHEIILEYIDFLIVNRLVYLSEQDIYFDERTQYFDFPAIISNSTILLKEVKVYDLKKVITAIENLGCENIQIFFEKQISVQDIMSVLSVFDNSRFLSIEILLPYAHFLSENNIVISFFENQTRLFKIQAHNAPETKRIFIDNLKYKSITYNKENINYSDCGFIHPTIFRNNRQFFTEAKNHNTCLNRKLCIDSNGDIKNCPAMKHSYGNIDNISLQKIVQLKEFQALWHINKDKIDVCKDCEFRYMCMDCRCYLKNIENIYSQPDKCNYNPYISKWKGQENYVPVEECGNYCRKTGFIPNSEKIASLNEQIWI